MRRGRLVAGLLVLVVVFLLGVAFGRALDDNPDSGKTRTFERTFQPFPQAGP